MSGTARSGTGYAELLRARHVTRLLLGTLVGRLPNATAHVAIVLFVRSEGGSYTLAGVLATVYGLATAVGQPLLGRAVDLVGQPRVMLPAALVSALGMLAFAAVGIRPLGLAAAAVLVAGLFTPPLEGGLRALWPSVLGRQDRVHRAYALDSVAQEVMFTIGPLVVTLAVALWSEAGALLVINVIGVLGALSVVASEPSRKWRSAPREAHWLGALRSSGLLALLGAFLFVGMALGSITVAAVAYADGEHGVATNLVYALLMSGIGFGALVGGLAYGARDWSGPPEPRLRVLIGLLALGYLPLLLVPGYLAMTLLACLAGLFLAPALSCAFVVVDRHAPRGTVTEAFSWLVTTFGVGAALGTAVVGPAIEGGGVVGGFAVPGAAGAAALLVLLATRRALAEPPQHATPDTAQVLTRPATRGATGENQTNRPSEPGFRSRHQA
ncbi:MFS transporter [Streptomyces alkaliterrae]|uniref:MFS transporter n=1 Tax=Streptomyces alkaliterrae TaxID=2213162 RepID=A0A5P0YMC9_9ACTN|nr:MFS transporter [Streptomyces alkaliterrae]MBB1252206.1 MFS transporter [Streptomyces alkaliterrae]MBB1258216.1 MFS transporter [Streptomyces alkaliterrae]MQS01431.1 MFS transporter [Streptomyces alkaliterrae]